MPQLCGDNGENFANIARRLHVLYLAALGRDRSTVSALPGVM